VITADTITDEQIREIHDAILAHPEFMGDNESGCALRGLLTAVNGALEYEEMHWIRDDRAKRLRAHCADIANALAAGASLTLTCSRCGCPVHRSWDHLDVGEHGERWTCPSRPNVGALTCDFHDSHDLAADLPTGNRCGAPASHRIDWSDGRHSLGCEAHLEIDDAATVKPIGIVPLDARAAGQEAR
jgi:hypothetical protein